MVLLQHMKKLNFLNSHKNTENRGGTPLSAVIGITVITSLVTAGITYVANSLLASPVQASAAIGSLQTDVAVLKTEQVNQDTEISTLTKGLDTINKNVVKLLIKNGVQPLQ